MDYNVLIMAVVVVVVVPHSLTHSFTHSLPLQINHSAVYSSLSALSRQDVIGVQSCSTLQVCVAVARSSD
jgi:hypothetical protein